MPDPAVPIINNTSTMITREDLFRIAKERQILSFVETLHKVTELGWSIEITPTSGGKIRYWVKLPTDDSWRVLFGMYVGGEKFSTPEAQPDVWRRPETVVQFSGETIDNVLKELRRFLPPKLLLGY